MTLTHLTLMQVIYMITFIGLIVLFIAILLNMVDKHQQHTLHDDLLDSTTKTSSSKPHIQSTALPNGDVVDELGNPIHY